MKLRCLGLDNSRYSTGWAVVDINTDENKKGFQENMKIIDYGLISTSAIKDEGKTLIYIEEQFEELFDKYHPDVIAAEQMFIGKNAQTGIILAGIHALMKLIATKNDCPVIYYPIMSAKSIVTGGLKLKKADGTRKTSNELKEEVAQAVYNIFHNTTFNNITDDVTDAISMVITYKRMNGESIGKQVSNVKSTKKKKTVTVKKK